MLGQKSKDFAQCEGGKKGGGISGRISFRYAAGLHSLTVAEKIEGRSPVA